MKIVLWIANQANQKALANKIHEVVPVEGIITESRKGKPRITVSKIFEKLVEKLFFRSIARSWFGMMDYYEEKYPDFPDAKILDVENINSDAAYAFTQKLQPDLIIVSGTRLIRKKLLSLNPRIGIMNLHTGLSPYIKGGPNCTNWCIATKQFHLIGNTVMWIDKGIDTGDIITTEFTNFTGSESLSQIHLKVMEHAHDLYVRSIGFIADNEAHGIPQDSIAGGETYYTKQWTLREKIKLVKNIAEFKKAVISGSMQAKRSNIKTIPLQVGKSMDV